MYFPLTYFSLIYLFPARHSRMRQVLAGQSLAGASMPNCPAVSHYPCDANFWRVLWWEIVTFPENPKQNDQKIRESKERGISSTFLVPDFPGWAFGVSVTLIIIV